MAVAVLAIDDTLVAPNEVDHSLELLDAGKGSRPVRNSTTRPRAERPAPRRRALDRLEAVQHR
jgi:hypothetical protein